MFSRNRPDRDDRASFGRRVNRMDFCAGVAFIVVFTMAVRPMVGGSSFYTGIGLCLGLAVSRIRDVGRIGSWVVLTPAIFPVALPLLRRSPLALGIDVSLMALTTLILVCYLTGTPGDPAVNRFGAPPIGVLNAIFAKRAARRSVRS